jgi:hypothetical protein
VKDGGCEAAGDLHIWWDMVPLSTPSSDEAKASRGTYSPVRPWIHTCGLRPWSALMVGRKIRNMGAIRPLS